MKDQEFYDFSHEVKTPFTNIKGFAHLLYNGEFGRMTREQRGYLKSIMEEADKGMLEIQKMLDRTKLAAGPYGKKIDQYNTILRIIGALEKKSGRKGVKRSLIVSAACGAGMSRRDALSAIKFLEREKDIYSIK